MNNFKKYNKFAVYFLFFASFLDAYARDINVYPASVSKLKNIELGEAIFLLMPDKSTKFIQWSFQSNNDKILWIDDTYKIIESSNVASRDGLIRINVKGAKSTILNKELKELAWSIEYINSISNPKFGPQKIILTPGVRDGNGNCFGSTADNCSFSPIKSLQSSNINFDIVCKTGSTENWGTTGLLLSAKGKKTVKMKWVTDGGSGGSSSWIEIYVGEQPEDMCEEK